jgi:predicted metal-dependent hydrolase
VTELPLPPAPGVPPALAAPAPRLTPEVLPLRALPGGPAVACTLRWRRSARARRVSLRIDPALGEVVITLPPGAGRRAGLVLLQAHAAWAIQRLAALAPPLKLIPGARVRLGDVPHPVLHDARSRAVTRLCDGRILVGGPPDTVPRRVLDFLRAEAGRRILPRAAGHAEALGVVAGAIRLKDTRSRWGSCAPDGTLAFSWRLVMAPDWVLDYVVAHEVTHLREMNHSPRFWAALARLNPHRGAAHAWLRQHGPGLLRVG